MWARTSFSRLVKVSSRRRRFYHSGDGCFGYRPVKRPIEPVFAQPELTNRFENAKLLRLVTAYRDHGHRYANLDPLGLTKLDKEINVADFGFSLSDNTDYPLTGLLYHPTAKRATLAEIRDFLNSTYCGSIAIESQHIPDEAERESFLHLVESTVTWSLSQDRQKELAKLMVKCQAFEEFMGKNYAALKRYSGEGADTLVAFVDELLSLAAQAQLERVIIGIPHRGRLALLTTLLGYPPAAIFSKLAGNSILPPGVRGEEDALSHLSSCSNLSYKRQQINVRLLPNSSHLEAINPIACGFVRSYQQQLGEGHYSSDGRSLPGDKVLCLQVHGDAAFTGQGVVAETLACSQVPHFSVGGSVHLVVNNQLGFTTPADRGRSSAYATDIAKSIGAPVIHCNGDNPEAVLWACNLAMAYRQKWKKDIFVDLICFRRWGHNELDEPRLTQPLMYTAVSSRPSMTDKYVSALEDDGILSRSEAKQWAEEHKDWLRQKKEDSGNYQPSLESVQSWWNGLKQGGDGVSIWDTGCPEELLHYVGMKSVELPEDFVIHPVLHRHTNARHERINSRAGIDWATAEAIAMGSLLYQGFNVRISGQDVGRGTFSHRHVMLVDQNTDQICIPLNSLSSQQTGFLEVANSPLSEEAVLGFEYGFSAASAQTLVMWEAQFGDFFNGAQLMLDAFVSSGESKWQLLSGLVILLPTGMDGAGAEHSSCRLERFLQLCHSCETGGDGDWINWHVVFPTTPAQYFHLLRQQMLRDFRKPLVIASPKTLLRLKDAVSTLADMKPGTHFQPVLGDDTVSADSVKRIIFCSGKHYYALAEKRAILGRKDTAIIRIELLAPFPAQAISKEISKFKRAKEFVWSQEESRNMGTWSFVAPRFARQLSLALTYCGRPASATPAVGVANTHQQQAEDVLSQPFSDKLHI